MSQYDFGTIDPDAKSGTQLAVDLNQWRDALLSNHKGNARPTYAVEGMVWINDNTTPWVVYKYDGAQDLLMGYIDPTNDVWAPVIGGGASTIASAATTDIGSVKASHVTINGSVNISSFGDSMVPGQLKTIVFGAGLTVVNGANLNLPAAGDTIVSANDRMIVVCESKTLGVCAYRVIAHIRSGAADVEPAGVVKDFSGWDLPAGYLWCDGSPQLRSTYANLFNALNKTRTGSITAGQKAVTATNIGVGVKPGMPISVQGAGTAGAVHMSFVTSATTNQINILDAAITTVSGQNVIISLHGLGNGTTTFNLPNRNGRAAVGADDMAGSEQSINQLGYTVGTTNASAAISITTGGGIAIGMYITHPNVPPGAKVLTIAADGLSGTLDTNAFATGSATGWFSSVQNANRVGAVGGARSKYIALNDLPPHPHPVSVTNPTHTHTANTTNPAHSHTTNLPYRGYNTSGGAIAFNNGGPDGALDMPSSSVATSVSVSIVAAAQATTAAANNQTTNFNPIMHADPVAVTRFMVKT